MRSSPRVTRKTLIEKGKESSSAFSYGTYFLVLFSFISIVVISYSGHAEIFDYKIKNVDVVEKLTAKNFDVTENLTLEKPLYEKGSIIPFTNPGTSLPVDYSGLAAGNHTIVITEAPGDGARIKLPEATTSNGGMEIKIVFQVPMTQDNYLHIGFNTTKMIGGATTVLGTAGDPGLVGFAQSAVGGNNLTINLRLNGVSNNAGGPGGNAGSKVTFTYAGLENQVFIDAQLISTSQSNDMSKLFSTTGIDV